MSATPLEIAPRHVLMTADTVGGVWTYALELARALQPHAVSFTIATMGAPLSDQQRDEAFSLRNVEIVQSTFKLEWMDNPWGDVAAAGEWLLQLEERLGPDVVHLNGYAHGSLGWSSPVLVVGHSCVLSWWRAVHKQDAPSQWGRYREAVSSGLQSAALVITPSETMRVWLEQHYGPLCGCRVVPNGRKLDLPKASPKQPLILAAGRLWDPAKNIRALDAIAGELRWPVFVAGDTTHPEGGETQMPNIRQLGRLSGPDLACWLERASIYAFPARYEPFGLSVLEAALAGCALVLGDISSLREIWGAAASYVPADDPSALRDILNELAEDPAQVAALAHKARERALRYTPELMAEGYLAAYSEILGRRQAQPRMEALPA